MFNQLNRGVNGRGGLGVCSVVVRGISQAANKAESWTPKPVFRKRIRGWQIHSYGGLEELQLGESLRFPKIIDHKEVIVQVTASSINPIDIAMAGKRNTI